MAYEIGIADKQTLDAVKSLVDQRLNVAVSSRLKGISVAYRFFHAQASGGTELDITVLDVSGSGFLFGYNLRGSDTGPRNQRIQIKVDNVVLYDADPPMGSTWFSICGIIPFQSSLFIRFYGTQVRHLGTEGIYGLV